MTIEAIFIWKWNNTAKKFGSNDFRVILVARNEKSLKNHVDDLTKQGIEAEGIAANAADLDSLSAAFGAIREKFGLVDVLLYNAAVIVSGTPTSITAQTLIERYKVDVAGALHSVLQVLPDQIQKGDGTILFTGGGFALYPVTDYASVSINKAALRNLALTLADELSPKGIFVGTVTVAGFIQEGTPLAADKVAEKHWELYAKKSEHEIILK